MDNLIKVGIRGTEKIFGEGLPKGCSILVVTPPILETRLFCMEFIFRGLSNEEPGMVVTTDESPEGLKEKALQYNWGMENAERKKILRWVDSYSINANIEVQSDDVFKRVGGPIALSDMAIAMSEIQSQFFRMKDRYRFAFDSLSTLLMYSSPDTIYYFLQSIVPKLKATGGIGFFTLSMGMHDPKVVMTIRHMMDGALEIDESLNLKILNMPFVTKTKTAKLTLLQDGFALT